MRERRQRSIRQDIPKTPPIKDKMKDNKEKILCKGTIFITWPNKMGTMSIPPSKTILITIFSN